MPCDASDSLEPTLRWFAAPDPPSASLACRQLRDFFSRLLVELLSAAASLAVLFRLPVGEAPTPVRPGVNDRPGVEAVRPKLPPPEGEESFLFACSRLSVLPTILRPSSSISSGLFTLTNLPSSGVVLRFAAYLESRFSDDFWRRMSEGLMLRSSELPGLSEERLPPELLGRGMVLPTNGVSLLGEDDSCCWLGMVGGSTRRMFFGGGLWMKKRGGI